MKVMLAAEEEVDDLEAHHDLAVLVQDLDQRVDDAAVRLAARAPAAENVDAE